MNGHLATLDRALAEVPGTVSVWYARLGEPPSYQRNEHVTHYAASTMKVATLAALHRHAEAGLVDLDAPVRVHNSFASAHQGAERFGCRRDDDSDELVWDRLGGTATPRWLAERMIARSSNLATNLLLERVGVSAAADAWSAAGGRHSVIVRGIEDRAAADVGLANLTTAADLGVLLQAIALGARNPGPLASPASCAAMITTLLHQEILDDLAAGLPPGTRVAHKNGWVTGVRHAAGVVFPEDAPPFVLAVCTSTPLAVNRRDDEACQLVGRIAEAAFADR